MRPRRTENKVYQKFPIVTQYVEFSIFKGTNKSLFAQSPCDKLASPEAARLRLIFFFGNSVVLHLNKGPEFRPYN